LLKHVLRRIHDTRIDIPQLLQGEEIRRML